MPEPTSRVLVIEREPVVCESLAMLLTGKGYSVRAFLDKDSALEDARTRRYDLAVAGDSRNGSAALALLCELQSAQPGAKVILTGAPDAATAVEAMRRRAFSYFHKPVQESPLADMAALALEPGPWRDDIRLISAVPQWISLLVRCRLAAVERTAQFVRELLASLPRGTRDDICVAYRELLLNAVEHGGGWDARKRVRTSVVTAGDLLILHLRDPGKGFSPSRLPHAAICNPAGDPTHHSEVRAGQGQRPGGFGLLIARNLADELLFNERGNEVLLVKRLR